MKNKKAFNGSDKRASNQHRIQQQPLDSQVLNRTTLKQIPRRLEALYIAFAKDPSNSDLILTREELDQNPSTRLLPSSEKDLLVKYWPTFQDKARKAEDFAKIRQAGVKTLGKDHRQATAIKRKHGIGDQMSVPDQLRATAHVCTGAFRDAVVTLAAARPLDEHTDELEIALWKNREQRARAFAHFAKVSIDLAVRIEEISTDEMQSAELSDEAQEALDEANAELERLGYAHLSATGLIDGEE